MKTLALLAIIFALTCCKNPETKTIMPLPDAPAETVAILSKEFPGVMTAAVFSDSIIHYLNKRYGITLTKSLLGVSTCVDDIIYTKNFHMHEIKGPFHLGGLAGLPFTGVAGLEAFAHHVPDSGTMIIIAEPHIGFSEKAGWGYVLRHEQHEPSSCCGALVGTLGKLQKGMLTGEISEQDYQGDKIGELALQNSKAILEAESPIIELTRITSRSAEQQIRSHVLEVDLTHVKYIVIMTGVLINTDYQYTDYQFLEHLLIFDVQKKKFVEEQHNPGVIHL